MTRYMDLHDQWMKDPEYAREYDALEEEFGLPRAMIAARVGAGLSRDDLAAKIGKRERTIARIEGGNRLPSTRTLKRIALATGTRLRISFEPDPARRPAGPTGDQT